MGYTIKVDGQIIPVSEVNKHTNFLAVIEGILERGKEGWILIADVAETINNKEGEGELVVKYMFKNN